MIHVRKPLQRRRGNSWYRDTSIQVGATFCGADCAYYDLSYRDTGYKKFNPEDPFFLAKGGVCPRCLELARLARDRESQHAQDTPPAPAGIADT